MERLKGFFLPKSPDREPLLRVAKLGLEIWNCRSEDSSSVQI
jgi:hypothetical protein